MKVKVRVYELVDHPDEEIKSYEIEEEIPPEKEHMHSWICQSCPYGDRGYPECREWCPSEGYAAVERRAKKQKRI